MRATVFTLGLSALLAAGASAQGRPRIESFTPPAPDGCSALYWLPRGGSAERVVLDGIALRMKVNGRMVTLVPGPSSDTQSVYTLPGLRGRAVLRTRSRRTGEETWTHRGTLSVTVGGRTTTVPVRGEGGC